MSKLISVVIPVYNVEQYIGKCLESILSQTYNNLEIIVVNDGATDGSGEIISQYTNDPRLKYIEQKNSGVSAARNAGINFATGDYIAFVDSDDYLELDMYEKLYDAIAKNCADMSVCDYNLIYDERIERKYSGMHDDTVDVSNNISDYFYTYCACKTPNNYVWSRLYRAEIVKRSGIQFQSFKLGDDTLFNFMLLPHINKVVNISDASYNYLQRASSNIYTVASRTNLAETYALTFSTLARYYKDNFPAFLEFLPVHAYTRLRSIFFYSRLAGLNDEQIIKSIECGFANSNIREYLGNTPMIDRYAHVNGLSEKEAQEIKRIMRAATNAPHELIGVYFK